MGASAKSAITLEGVVGSPSSQLCATFAGLLQGGTPKLDPDSSQFLGSLESKASSPAVAALKDLDRRGAVAVRGACSAAESLEWPLVARQLCFTHAHSALDFLLPLAVEYANSAFRLNALQETTPIPTPPHTRPPPSACCTS